MDKTYTFSDLVKEFNFDSESTRKLFAAHGIKPSKVLMVGKRKIELYGPTAHAAAKAERARRDAERAARGRKSPVVNLKKNTPKDFSKLEQAYWELADQLDDVEAQLARIESAVQNLPILLSGMEARLKHYPDFTKAYPPGLTPDKIMPDNSMQYQTLANIAEMASISDD